MLDGEISIPVPRTTQALKESIQKKIEGGKFNMGNMIVPREYKKLTVSPEGNIEEQVFYVSGRQIPLQHIREQTLKDHEIEERTGERPQ